MIWHGPQHVHHLASARKVNFDTSKTTVVTILLANVSWLSTLVFYFSLYLMAPFVYVLQWQWIVSSPSRNWWYTCVNLCLNWVTFMLGSTSYIICVIHYIIHGLFCQCLTFFIAFFLLRKWCVSVLQYTYNHACNISALLLLSFYSNWK